MAEIKLALFVIFVGTLVLYAKAFEMPDHRDKDYFINKTNIVVASGYLTSEKQLKNNFFKYFLIENDKYLRVAHQYYGDLLYGDVFEIDELAKIFLLREASQNDWALIFINHSHGKVKINGCDIYPVEMFPSEVLSGGREAIIEYILKNKMLKNFCG